MPIERGPLNSSEIPEAQPVAGVYNVTPPAPQDTQGCALQVDANGNLLVNVAVGGGGGSSTVKIEDTSGNALNSNGSGALNVAVVSGGGSNASVGLTGAAAPTSATEIGIVVAGNLQNVSAANPMPVAIVSGELSTVTVVQPTGTNLHVVVDSGSSITAAVTGTKTNNSAAPDGNILGVLPIQANAANPSWTEGNLVTGSVDLAGRNRITGQAASGVAIAGNPVLVAGRDNAGNVQAVSINNSGGANGPVRVTSDTFTGADAASNLLTGFTSNNGNPILLFNSQFVFNGTTWDRARSAGIGNAVAATGIQAVAVYGEYNTTAPAPTTGQYSNLQTDYAGSLFTKPIRRSTTVNQATTIASSSASTTVLAAQAAGIFADLSNVIITVTTAATTSISFTATLSDGTNNFIFDMETGSLTTAAPSPLVINFNPPLSATTAATAWTVTLSVNTVTVHISVNAVLQKAS